MEECIGHLDQLATFYVSVSTLDYYETQKVFERAGLRDPGTIGNARAEARVVVEDAEWVFARCGCDDVLRTRYEVRSLVSLLSLSALSTKSALTRTRF